MNLNGKKIISGEKGFSLVESMIALLLFGAISTTLMQMQSNQTEMLKRGTSRTDEAELVSRLNLIMSEKSNCESTLSGLALNSSFSEVRYSSGSVAFRDGDTFGPKRTIRLSGFSLKGATVPGANSSGTLELLVSFERLKSSLGQRNASKSVLLQVKTNNLNLISECSSLTDSLNETTVEESCSMVGGEFDPILNQCNLSTPCVQGSNETATSTECLSDVSLQYLPLSGGNITGDLNGVRVSANSLCINGNCRKSFDTKTCGHGRFIRTINSDGSIICSDIIKCASNLYLQGINKVTGKPICKPLPTKTCPSNEYVSEINSDGTVRCKPVSLIKDITCKDGEFLVEVRNGELACAEPVIEEVCKKPRYYKSSVDSAMSVSQCLVDTEIKDFSGKCKKVIGTVNATAGLCKKLETSCNGDIGGSVSNYADGTSCDTNKICKSGKCVVQKCYETSAGMDGSCSNSYCGGIPDCPSSDYQVTTGLVKCDTGSPIYNGNSFPKCKFQFGPTAYKSIGVLKCNEVSCQ